jgi:hypothetical protein
MKWKSELTILVGRCKNLIIHLVNQFVYVLEALELLVLFSGEALTLGDHLPKEVLWVHKVVWLDAICHEHLVLFGRLDRLTDGLVVEINIII